MEEDMEAEVFNLTGNIVSVMAIMVLFLIAALSTMLSLNCLGKNVSFVEAVSLMWFVVLARWVVVGFNNE